MQNTIFYNDDLFDNALEKLSDLIFSKRQECDYLTGDLTGKEFYCKTMSDKGLKDKKAADNLEKWLKENFVEYRRTDYRHFYIMLSSFEKPLKDLLC